MIRGNSALNLLSSHDEDMYANQNQDNSNSLLPAVFEGLNKNINKQELTNWIIAQDEDVLLVKVKDPRLVTFRSQRRRTSTSTLSNMLGSSAVFYNITSKRNENGVERTFSDFVLLREALCIRFQGAIIPPLPAKKTIGNQKEHFVRKRCRFLELFLQSCADNPFIKNDILFSNFIEQDLPFESSHANTFQLVSEGMKRWREVILSFPPPKDVGVTIENVTKELVAAQKCLTLVKNAAKDDVEKAVARADSTNIVAEAMDNWGAVERAVDQKTVLGGSISITHSDAKTVSSTLTQIVESLAKKTALHSGVMLRYYGEDQLQNTILDAARFELAIISVWLEKLEEAGFAEKKIRKANDARAAALHGGEDSLKYKEATVNLVDAQKQACKFERGLLSLELMRLRQNRVIRWMRLKQDISKLHVEGCIEIQNVWLADNEFAVSLQRKPSLSSLPPPPPKPVVSEPVALDREKIEKQLGEITANAVAKAVEAERERVAGEMAGQAKQVRAQVMGAFWGLTLCLCCAQVILGLVLVWRRGREGLVVLALSALTVGFAFLADVSYRKEI